jgi:hypothetical protein
MRVLRANKRVELVHDTQVVAIDQHTCNLDDLHWSLAWVSFLDGCLKMETGQRFHAVSLEAGVA